MLDVVNGEACHKSKINHYFIVSFQFSLVKFNDKKTYLNSLLKEMIKDKVYFRLSHNN